MAIAVDQNYDKAQRKISTANLKQFAGVDCQLLVEKETHRPIIMDGKTIGGKSKVALVADLEEPLKELITEYGGTVPTSLSETNTASTQNADDPWADLS